MTLHIDYLSHAFPATYALQSGTLSTLWDELLWAAITIGRPSTYHVFRYGEPSFYEAIFRLAWFEWRSSKIGPDIFAGPAPSRHSIQLRRGW